MAPPENFSRTQIYLHWIIAAMVLFQIVLHDSIVAFWRQRMDATIPNEAFPTPHSIVGILIFVLVVIRLGIRMRRGVPDLPAGEPPWMGMVSKLTHALFYLLLLGMPVSGVMAWFFGSQFSATTHSAAKFILVPLVLLHIAAALAHHFLFGTNVLRRMLGIKSRS